MKKVFIALAVLVASFGANAQVFDFGQFRAGAGLGYNTDASNVGININAVYNFSPRFEAAVGFTHFFEKDYHTNNMLDVDAHWVFYDEGSKFNLYGIAGLCLNFYKIEIPSKSITAGGMATTIPGTSVSDSDAGINIGIGANYKLSDRFNLAPEVRYTMLDDGFLRLGASLQYVF